MPCNGAENGRINNYDGALQKQRKGSADISNVYYSMLKGTDGTYYLNYHMFYTYDVKGGSANNPGNFAHAFDRESMTLVFNSKPDTTTVPAGVIYGAHMDDQNLQLLKSGVEVGDGVLGTDPYFFWEGPGVFVPWENAYKYKVQPVVAVAKGSHALYPVCGTYEIMNWSSEPAGGSDEFAADAEWNRLLVPPNLEGNNDNYSLTNLNIGRITSYSENKYLTFSGAWIDTLGWWDNPKFPPFTDREKSPETWYSDAPRWELDHCDLPQYSKELMEDLFLLLTNTYGGCTDAVCEPYYPGGECGGEEYDTIWFIPNATSYSNRVPASQIRYKFMNEFANKYYAYSAAELSLVSELAKDDIDEIDAQYQFLNTIVELIKAAIDISTVSNLSPSELTDFLNNADFLQVILNNLKRMGVISSDTSDATYVFQEMITLVINLYLEVLKEYPDVYWDIDTINLTKEINATGTATFYIGIAADVAEITNGVVHAVQLTSVTDTLNSYLIAHDFIKSNICSSWQNSVIADILIGESVPISCDYTDYKEFIETTYDESGMFFPGVNAFYATGKPVRYTIERIFDLFSNIPNKVGNYSYAEWYDNALDWTDYVIFNYNSFDPH